MRNLFFMWLCAFAILAFWHPAVLAIPAGQLLIFSYFIPLRKHLV
jgi:hypothetical protein